MEITFYRKLAYKVADAVIEGKPYSEAEEKRIRHGLVCIFSDLYKAILYLIIFSVFSLTKEYLIAFIGLMLLRSYIGGFHAKSELSCIFLSFFILLFSILLGNINILNVYLQIIFIIIFPIIGVIISPVKVDKIEKGNLKAKLLAGSISLTILLLDFYLVPGQILFWITVVTYILALFQLVKNYSEKTM